MGHYAVIKNKELQLVPIVEVTGKVFTMQELLLLLDLMPTKRLEVSQEIVQDVYEDAYREESVNTQTNIHRVCPQCPPLPRAIVRQATRRKVLLHGLVERLSTLREASTLPIVEFNYDGKHRYGEELG